ncbi:hypothetical protein [Umezawaea beigongshangensis]|uniref:hypothetical protein n=1 Tax=Umezawaea beigongshangensis TaxID=2780383 RepID=UPI0018F23871|nr:hypothetical protein [Umezawaea beigongshangensis]
MGDDRSEVGEGPLEYQQARVEFYTALDRELSLWACGFDDPTRHDLAEAQSAAVEAYYLLMSTAPSAPTEWWPGGWVASGPDWQEGKPWSGQAGSVQAWRTEQEAHDSRPEQIPPDHWVVRWTPTAEGRDTRLWALDAVFWRREDSNDDPLLEEQCELDDPGIVNTLLWVGTAAASGMIGNAAYDAAKAAVRKLTGNPEREALEETTPSRSSASHDPVLSARQELEIDIPPAAPPVLGEENVDPT